jgi:hypothetical protein
LSKSAAFRADLRSGFDKVLKPSPREAVDPATPGSFAMHKISTAAFVLAVSVMTANLAKADQPGPDWMPAQQVIEKVLQSGYTQVTELKADDGRWEGEGVKNGQKMEFHADPKTGVVTFEKLDH